MAIVFNFEVAGVNNDEDTRLIIAAKMGSFDQIPDLVKSGIDLEIKDEYDNTALNLLARMQKIDLVKLLLDNGANIDTVNCNKYTPLHYAALLNDVDLVKLLLEYNANDQLRDFEDDLPIQSTFNQTIKELLTNYQHMSNIKEPAN